MTTGPYPLTHVCRLRHPRSMSDDVMTVDEAAKRYGVTRGRVHQWIRAGLSLAPETVRDALTGDVLRVYLRSADIDAWRSSAASRQDTARRKPKRKPPLPEGLEWASEPNE